MTASALARFADSPGALSYANVCARWGVDPAAGLADDVLASDLRAALVLRMTWSEAAREAEARAASEQADEFQRFLDTPREVEPWRA